MGNTSALPVHNPAIDIVIRDAWQSEIRGNINMQRTLRLVSPQCRSLVADFQNGLHARLVIDTKYTQGFQLKQLLAHGLHDIVALDVVIFPDSQPRTNMGSMARHLFADAAAHLLNIRFSLQHNLAVTLFPACGAMMVQRMPRLLSLKISRSFPASHHLDPLRASFYGCLTSLLTLTSLRGVTPDKNMHLVAIAQLTDLTCLDLQDPAGYRSARVSTWVLDLTPLSLLVMLRSLTLPDVPPKTELYEPHAFRQLQGVAAQLPRLNSLLNYGILDSFACTDLTLLSASLTRLDVYRLDTYTWGLGAGLPLLPALPLLRHLSCQELVPARELCGMLRRLPLPGMQIMEVRIFVRPSAAAVDAIDIAGIITSLPLAIGNITLVATCDYNPGGHLPRRRFRRLKILDRPGSMSVAVARTYHARFMPARTRVDATMVWVQSSPWIHLP